MLYLPDLRGCLLPVVPYGSGISCSHVPATSDCGISSTRWSNTHTEVYQIPTVKFLKMLSIHHTWTYFVGLCIYYCSVHRSLY